MVRGAIGNILCLVVVGVFILMTPSSASAVDNPDTLEIDNVLAYQEVLKEGDLLVILEYDLRYDTLPEVPANDAFLGRFLDGTTELDSDTPVPYVNSGYTPGVMSFYFAPSEVDSLGIVIEDPYTVAIQGNPSVFGSPPSVTTNSITWRDVGVTKIHLRNDLVRIGTSLELSFTEISGTSIDLVQGTTEGEIFTDTGEDYFSSAIQDLSSMIPGLYSGSAFAPEFRERDFDTSYSQGLQEFWIDTYFGDVMQQWADIFGVEFIFLTTIILTILTIAAVALTSQALNTFDFAPLVIAFMFSMGAFIGMTDMILAGLMTAASAAGVAYILFFRRA